MSAIALARHESGPDRLPALIDRARQTLAAARSSAEVLEAKAIAEAALHYAKVTKAANETHADCLRMIVRAEMRMADEIDRGQQAGEVQSQKQGVRAPDTSTLNDLGVDRRRLDEWREVRDAGPEVVEQAIERALAKGQAPTKADIHRAISGDPHVSNNSGENEWYTPAEYIEAARRVLGEIDLDPASSKSANKVVRAKAIYSASDSGLDRPWRGRVWMNPPYAQPLVSQFCAKFAESVGARDVTAGIALVNNATETKWFESLVNVSSALCFPTGRVKFWSPAKESAQPLQGQALIYAGRRVEQFRKQFAEFGWTVAR